VAQWCHPKSISRPSSADPSLTPEVEHHATGREGHQNQQRRVGPLFLQLRHVFEVHSVDAGHERQGDEDAGDEVHYSIVRPESYGEAWNIRLQVTPVIKSPFIK